MLGSAGSDRALGLDVLRGVAAVAVMFSHYINWWDRYVADIPVIAPGLYGYHAVQLFFVISGVVIFNTLQKCQSVRHFAFLRFSRLYPTYWATLLGVALLTWLLFGQAPWPGGLIVNTTMFQEFLGYPNLDNVYWSLTIELAFYVHVAWLFALGWHTRVYRVCACWLILACIWAIAVGKPNDEERDLFALLFVFDQAAFFVIGIMIFTIRENGIDVFKAATLGAAFITAFIVEGLSGLLVAVTLAALVLAAIYGKLNFLVNRVTLWFGNISFALYLVHRNLGYLWLEKLSAAGYGPVISIVPMIVMATLLAWLVHEAVEKPSLTALRRIGDQRFKPVMRKSQVGQTDNG